MTSVYHIVRNISHEFDESHLSLPFDQSGLDSFDLLHFRVKLEQETATTIPDNQWISFKSLQDIQEYIDKSERTVSSTSSNAGITSNRNYSLNMPQMALGGLSESWLFKEFGDTHWGMTCDALASESHLLVDELGNRLYATFVRVRFESSHRLRSFEENERLALRGHLRRFGKSMFFSDVTLGNDQKQINAKLMTTFSLRQSNNKSLLKGEPHIPSDSKVESVDSIPALAQEYREMRQGDLNELRLGGEKIRASNDLLFETTYQLNPYYDLNGVNLLYFAAYPMISDYCEMEFVKAVGAESSGRHWPLDASTIARDVFYYGNSDLDDRIVFGLNSFAEELGRVKISTSLFRETDRQLIANIFTVKEISR